MDDTQPGWYPDPSNRHERRYWTGARWSRHVIDQGVRNVDPDGASRIPGRRPIGLPSDAGPTTFTPPAPAVAGQRIRRGPPFVAVVAIGAVLGTLLGTVFIVAGADGGREPDTRTSPEREQYVEAITVNMTEIAGDDTLDAGQLDCVAQRLVDRVGLERLAELDILNTPETISQQPLVTGADAQATYREAFGCLDDRALVAFLAATVSRATELPMDDSRCIMQGWLDALGRDTLVDSYANLSTEWAGVGVDSSIPERDLMLSVAAKCAPPAPPSP